jgi:GntR family transcriptional regulator
MEVRRVTSGTETRYAQIAQYLRTLVAAGSPGDRLPSDAELCERFSVSRMTARQAVGLLLSEGLLYRRRGRGTFVAARPVQRLLGSPLSFTENMRRRGRRATSRVLKAEIAKPSSEDVKALDLNQGDRVVVLERLRLADETPMAIERAVLAPDLEPVLEEDLKSASLHQAMERIGRIPTRAHAQVTARAAAADERMLLKLPPGGALLCERRVITDQHGTPLEHTETRYAAQRYVFEVVLHRDEQDLLQ